MTTSHPGGTGTIGGHRVARIGYGAMGLGRELLDDDAAAVLHRVVELGVNHIDTASFYDDGVVNRRIRDALAPYQDDLLIVSKVGARPATGPIPLALAQHPADLRHAVELDLAGLGLDAVRFAHPVQVAGTWASAMNGGVLELVRDQRIGPVFHFDDKAQDGYGGWVLDPSRPYLECKKGQQARFNVPLIDYDIVAEFGKPEPDGPAARFKPSQWAVTECFGAESLEVKPAYTEEGPADAQAQVWELKN